MKYYLSTESDIEILKPKVPDYAFGLSYKDDYRARVEMTNRIEGGLDNIYPLYNTEIYVYEALNPHTDVCIPSAWQFLTGPLRGIAWVYHDVPVKCIGRIRVDYKIYIGKHKVRDQFMKLYDYRYKWVSKQ